MSVDQQKMLFGFATLLILGVLAAIIGLGDVKKETSFGLEIILGGLVFQSGSFCQWAFGARKE